MHRAHVFILLSQTAPDGDSEGTPTALIEAGALGLPSISTFHAGIPEVIADGITGILVAEGDYESATKAIIKLAQAPALRAALGAAARENILREFSIEKVIQQIETDYGKLASTPGRDSQ